MKIMATIDWALRIFLPWVWYEVQAGAQAHTIERLEALNTQVRRDLERAEDRIVKLRNDNCFLEGELARVREQPQKI